MNWSYSYDLKIDFATYQRMRTNSLSWAETRLMFDLTTILYSNKNYYIDAMSDGILTRGTSDMGKLYSTRKLRKISSAVIIQKYITL